MVLSPKIQDTKRLQLANIQEERMVTGAIKNKVDKIWTDIWAGGITNPLTVIEQLTYLMFIRSLDEKELATEDFVYLIFNGSCYHAFLLNVCQLQTLCISNFW